MKAIFVALLAIIAVSLTADYAVNFKEQVDFKNLQHPITHQSVKDLDFKTKGRLVHHELKRVASISQKFVRTLLKEQGYTYTPFYISNTIVVHNGDERIADLLRQREDVESVEKLGTVTLPDERAYDTKLVKNGPEWNIEMVKAPEAWSKGIKGKGVVVGVLDTGINYEHKDLAPKYRGYNGGNFDHDYNWYDGVSRQNCKDTPCDQHGHGSHVTGTVLGSNDNTQVGVAPEAQWVACRAFATGSATARDILKCFEWFLAPTKTDGSNEDPDKRPHLVNHSWGSSRKTTAFDKAVEALHAAGTLNVFAAGNSGSRCSSLGYPGAHPDVLTVAALDYKKKTVARFSSRGPAREGKFIKPEVSAPGAQITSCSNRGDGYRRMSGTSMASPCVAGSVALLYSADSSLIGKIEETKEMMQKNCEPIKSTNCRSPQDHPNYVYGYGMIDNSKLRE